MDDEKNKVGEEGNLFGGDGNFKKLFYKIFPFLKPKKKSLPFEKFQEMLKEKRGKKQLFVPKLEKIGKPAKEKIKPKKEKEIPIWEKIIPHKKKLKAKGKKRLEKELEITKPEAHALIKNLEKRVQAKQSGIQTTPRKEMPITEPGAEELMKSLEKKVKAKQGMAAKMPRKEITIEKAFIEKPKKEIKAKKKLKKSFKRKGKVKKKKIFAKKKKLKIITPKKAKKIILEKKAKATLAGKKMVESVSPWEAIESAKKTVKFREPTGEEREAEKKKRQEAMKEFHEEFTGKEKNAREGYGEGPTTIIKASGGVKLFYKPEGERGEERTGNREQIAETEEKIKNLQREFFKRHVTEEEFRQKMFKYKEKLHLLKMKKAIGEENGGGEEIMPEEAIERAKQVVKTKSRGETQVREIELKPEKGEFELGKNEIQKILQAKSRGKIDEDRLKRIEEKVQQIAEKYQIPEEEVKEDLQKLDANKLISDFDKLINLIELEHKTKQLTIPSAPLFERPSYVIQQKKEEAKGIIKEIQKHRIVTDFDKIISLVKERGRIRESEAMKELGMDRKRLKECCEVLEENGLVKLEYPPVGEIKIVDTHAELRDLIKKTWGKEQKIEKKMKTEKIEKKKAKQKHSFFGFKGKKKK